MNRFLISFSLFLLLPSSAVVAKPPPGAVENDLIYPSVESARPYMDFDGAGFIINGQRTYLSSGTIHYPRVPPELWKDRLERLQRASFAGVETYAFWNFHEPRENQFDFTAGRDFEKYLDTAQQLGLYAIVRVGPYVCAEWDSGGYPVWLKFKPSFLVRTNDPAWLAWNDHWYEKILPIVAKHQINHGGNVVLVQLENEHPLGWGVVTNNPYFLHLNDEAVKLGIEVPHFMSGLHHGGTPMPDNLDSSQRANPWFTTEFWAGWYDVYGKLSDEKNRALEHANWNILAHGGGGHNFYTLHGGTDFDSWNGDEMAASYDDGAVIGQAGDLRPMYYRMKRANQLAESFPDILANGNDARDDFKNFATGPGIKIIGARKSNSDAGTLVFIENSTGSNVATTFKSGGRLNITRFSYYAFPQQAVVAEGLKIASSTLPVLAVAHNGAAVTIVVYGRSDESGQLTLSADEGFGSSQPDLSTSTFAMAGIDANNLNLKITIPTNGVGEWTFHERTHFIRVLAVNEDLSLYTWVLGRADRQYVVCGPEYVQGVDESHGNVAVTLERPYGQPACGQVAVFAGPGQSWHLGANASFDLDSKPAPKLSSWQMSPMTEASPAFDDSAWKHSESPLQMGADGDNSAFAWYRASVDVVSTGSGTVHFHGADNLEVFVNGQKVDGGNNHAKAGFVAGKNSIAIFASHHGRNKNYNYLGTLDDRDNKGLWGLATLELNGVAAPIHDWSMRGGIEADLQAIENWDGLADSERSPAFYRATFQVTPPGTLGAHAIIRVNYQGLSRGTMWINGHNLGRYPEKIPIDSLYVPECWLNAGENVLTVFDETGASPVQVSLVVETSASREVIRADKPASPSTPIIIAQQP